jgi:hypothetical protein
VLYLQKIFLKYGGFMPAVATKSKVNNVIDAFQQLNEKEIDLFYEKTREKFLSNLAKRLDSILPANDMTMEEIVAETKAMRRARDAKN